MFELFIAELARLLILTFRYPVTLIVNIMMNFAYFFCLFTGAKYIAGGTTEQFGCRAGGMVLGYFIWILANSGLGHVTMEIEKEARAGTLENIFLSGHRNTTIFVLRGFTGVVLCMIHMAIVVPLVMIATQTYLFFPASIVIPCGTIIIATSGIGLMVGGGAILFKRFGDVLVPIQYGVLLLMMIPSDSWPEWFLKISTIVPGIPGVMILREIMVFNKPVDMELLAYAVFNALFYLVLGIMVFHQMVLFSKRRGLVGGY